MQTDFGKKINKPFSPPDGCEGLEIIAEMSGPARNNKTFLGTPGSSSLCPGERQEAQEDYLEEPHPHLTEGVAEYIFLSRHIQNLNEINHIWIQQSRKYEAQLSIYLFLINGYIDNSLTELYHALWRCFSMLKYE